jgi:hypothetical protein
MNAHRHQRRPGAFQLHAKFVRHCLRGLVSWPVQRETGMNRDDPQPQRRHYRDRMADTGTSKHRPKVCLVAIKAARQYREMLDAADAARRQLVAEAVRRAPDRKAALAVLNHLADSFRLPAFKPAELADDADACE